MEISLQTLGALIVTPIFAAIAALFWQLIKQYQARLEDRDRQIVELTKALDQYREGTLPALHSVQNSQERLADVFEALVAKGMKGKEVDE